MDKDLEAPCITCTGYSNFVKGDMYMTPSHAAQPLKEAIDDWFKETNGVSPTDFLYNPVLDYDTVEKPKHYMLFEEQGIEVRDVIKQLMKRVYAAYNEEGNTGNMTIPTCPMFDSDYVQMMQYLMRFMDKNGQEDLKKARWYLDKLIQAYAEDSYESDF
jgi:hypothetical protein